MAFDPEKIEARIDRTSVAGIELNSNQFGLEIKNMVELQEVAKTMSLSKQALPLYLRNEPGLCFAILMRSTRWGIDPFFVAEQSYLVTNPKSGEEKIAFMAQLFNAIINKAEPLILEGKLRIRYEGEGDDMKGVVYGIPKRETEPLEFETPLLGKRKKDIGFNSSGNFKGSPLYLSDPDQALWYYGSRGFIRRYFPHVLAGCYSQEEMQEAGWQMRDVTPKPAGDVGSKGTVSTLADRLKEKKRALAKPGDAKGFDPDHIEREHAKMSGSDEGAAQGSATTKELDDDGGKAEAGDVAGRVDGGVQDDRREADDNRANPDGDATAGSGGDEAAKRPVSGAPGDGATQAGEQQQELLPPEPKGNSGKRRTK